MAIIYSYPIATPQDTDLLIISRTPTDPDEISNYSVDMSSVADYVIDEAFNGTDRYIPRFDGTSSLVNSVIYEDSNGSIGISTQTPDTKLDVAGRAVIGTGNTLTNATNATVIGNSNNLTNDSIVDSNTNLILGDYGAGRYANTVISDRTLRLGRADIISASSSNTTGILNFNDSVEANSAFSNVGGFVGYFPPPNTTNDYYFINAFSENVSGSAFAAGASPTASRYNMSTSPSLNCIGQKFDANTTNAGAVYINASNNSPTPSSRGIVTFDIRHQNQNYAAPDGHALFEVTSGYGQTKFIIKQVNGSSNVGIGTTSPAEKLHVVGNIQINDHDGTGNLQIGASDGAGNDAIIGMAARNSSNGISPKVELRTIYDSSGGANGSAFTISTRSGSGVAERMRIDSTGNVGIGTTSPGSRLQVDGEIDANGGDGYRIFGRPWAVWFSDLLTLGDWDGEGYATRIMDSDSNEAIRIIDSGKVGIGTTSPASKLEVDGGDIEIDDSASGLILRSPNGTRYRVQVDNSGNLTTTAI